MSRKQSLALAAALLLVLLANSVYVVDQRAVAVVLQFDSFSSAVTQPGLHFKLPFAQNVVKFDHRLLNGSRTDTVTTGDQKTLNVDYYFKWRIADIPAYYRATGGKSLFAGDRLSTVVSRSLRDALGSRSIEDIVSGDRDKLDEALRSQAQAKAGELGVEVVDVRIENLGLPKDVADAYYERMRAERRRMAEELRARGGEDADNLKATADSEAQTTLAEAYRKAQALRGEGDAKAAEIYAQAYGQDPEFFAFYRSLNAYRDAFAPKPGDAAPHVIVVEPKGEFFKYFKDPGNGK